MITATQNVWPFAVSVDATGVVTSTAEHTTQATDLRYKCGMTGEQVWQAMVLSNAQQAKAIRDNTPEATV